MGQKLTNIHKESFRQENKRPNADNSNSLQVTFFKLQSNVTESIESDGSQTLLELSDVSGAGVNSACRSGNCGACLVKVNGENFHEGTGQLTEAQLEEGYRLACICYPKTNCQVEIL